jgi:4'-phosphopantetheinyl transferase
MPGRTIPTSLKAGEAHLWLFILEQFIPVKTDWEQLLSEEERTRSKRFITERDRKRFVARRGILRQLLGYYCGLDPARVSYQADPNGKLYLPSNHLSFNLSKSGERVAYVFSLEKETGVDIEQPRPFTDLSLLAKRAFSQEERAALAELPPSSQVEAFYHTWTQKEAFIKATGMGLKQALEDFSVSVDPGKPGKLLSIKGNRDRLSNWKMTCFKPEEGLHVAVCIRSKADLHVSMFVPDPGDFISFVSSGKKAHSV